MTNDELICWCSNHGIRLVRLAGLWRLSVAYLSRTGGVVWDTEIEQAGEFSANQVVDYLNAQAESSIDYLYEDICRKLASSLVESQHVFADRLTAHLGNLASTMENEIKDCVDKFNSMTGTMREKMVFLHGIYSDSAGFYAAHGLEGAALRAKRIAFALAAINGQTYR